MTDIQFAGRIESALTHFALLGAAALLRDAGVAGVAVWFSDAEPARPHLRLDGEDTDLAATLRDHASCAIEGWIGARTPHEGSEPRGTMSPRLKAPSSEQSWQSLQAARRTELDALVLAGRVADLALVGALGEPAYWPAGAVDIQPDRGASRWEMKTRNRGEEFIADRLHKLAVVVARRSDAEIIKGLTGLDTVDDTGGSGPGSRTATGLSRPGPVDSAMAWCALWGIASFPVTPAVGLMSQTPGSFPRRRVHPAVMVLPAVSQPTSLLRLRSAIRSAALDAFMQPENSDRVAAGRWLAEHGVAAVVRFPIVVAGSTSAPERQVLDGEVAVLS